MAFKRSGELTPKQKRFADEYLVDCVGSKAAVRAGYSERSSRSAAYRLLANPAVRAYIDEQLACIHAKNIADAEEVLAFLTRVMRGETKEQVVMRAGGDQYLEMMEVPARERLKAAELIGKRYSMFSENTAAAEPVVICGGDELKDP